MSFKTYNNAYKKDISKLELYDANELLPQFLKISTNLLHLHKKSDIINTNINI